MKINLRGEFPLKDGNGGYSIRTTKNRPRRIKPSWATDEKSILLALAMTPRIKQNVKIATKYYVEGWDCADIAEEMGMTKGAVQSRLMHIRRIV